MGDARTVGEDAARVEGLGPALEGQRALAAGDEFDRMEGEVGAVDAVVRAAALAPAADHRQRLADAADRVEVEPLGLEHLVRVERRDAAGIADFVAHGDQSRMVMLWTTFDIFIGLREHYNR